MANVPPGISTRFGPVSCSSKSGFSYPPHSASLYFHPVVIDLSDFLQLDQRSRELRATNNVIRVNFMLPTLLGTPNIAIHFLLQNQIYNGLTKIRLSDLLCIYRKRPKQSL